MSVEIKVELNTGATMGFERGYMQTSGGTPAATLRELDKGYKMLRDWLLSQMPPDLSKPTAAAPPEPERRVQEIVRETIQDDARRSRWGR